MGYDDSEDCTYCIAGVYGVWGLHAMAGGVLTIFSRGERRFILSSQQALSLIIPRLDYNAIKNAAREKKTMLTLVRSEY